MKYLLEQLKKYRLECILAPLFKMLEAFFDLFVPIVVANIINKGIQNQDKNYIFANCGILVLLALIGLLCSFTAQFFAAKAAVGCSAGIRAKLFAHIQQFGFSEIDTMGTSTLITRMTSDINQIQNGVNLFLRLFLRSPFIVFGAMIMAFTIDFKAAIVLCVAIPVLFIIVFGFMRLTSPLYKKIQSKVDNVVGITRENLTGVRVIRAFGKENDEIKRFEDANDELLDMQTSVGRISGLLNPLTYVVVNLGIIAILNTGAISVNTGTLLSGDVVALINYMSQILVELVKMANVIMVMSKALASLSRVGSVIDTDCKMEYSEKTDDKCDNNLDEIVGSDEIVRFENVSLKYEGAGDESISDVNFTVKKGQTIGIIGGTGSGKSTLVNLIPRFYDATKGEIFIKGKNIRTWTKDELNSYVGIVMQKAQLFAGTIRSNLLLGNNNATDEQLWKALEMAQAAEFVKSKPLGLDEKVEQGGRNFSGGQKQRISIARTLVKNAEILILDDSSSALDNVTDAALRKALNSLTDTTVFIVSQRASSLKHAEQIIVLDDGKIIDIGTNDELLSRCEVYTEIYESQFKKEV